MKSQPCEHEKVIEETTRQMTSRSDRQWTIQRRKKERGDICREMEKYMKKEDIPK